jgi:hypothetical protein
VTAESEGPCRDPGTQQTDESTEDWQYCVFTPIWELLRTLCSAV